MMIRVRLHKARVVKDALLLVRMHGKHDAQRDAALNAAWEESRDPNGIPSLPPPLFDRVTVYEDEHLCIERRTGMVSGGIVSIWNADGEPVFEARYHATYSGAPQVQTPSRFHDGDWRKTLHHLARQARRQQRLEQQARYQPLKRKRGE